MLTSSAADSKVYRSSDGGDHWTDITGAFGSGEEIHAVAISGDKEYWAGTSTLEGGNLYYTKDGGTSWTKQSVGHPANLSVRSIFVDPDDARILYVTFEDPYARAGLPSEARVFKTTNSGNEWTKLYLPSDDPPAGPRVIGKALTSHTIYIVNRAKNLYALTNNNQTWTPIVLPGTLVDIMDIAIDPQNNSVLYLPVRSRAGILKSIDAGKTWSQINQGLISTSAMIMAMSPVVGSGTLYTNGGPAIFKTTDRGNLWTRVDENGIDHPFPDELTFSPLNQDTVWYIADVARGYITTNGGKAWTKTIDATLDGKGFRFGTVTALAPAPADPDILYALKSGFGIFKKIGSGSHWTFLPNSEVDYSYTLAVHPTKPDILYSGYSPKPFQNKAMVRQTKDGGSTWRTALEVPQSDGITSVAIDLKQPDVVYAGSIGKMGGTIYKSANGGDSWSKLNDHFTMLTVWGQPQLIVDPSNASTAYAATWLGGTWKTADAGQTWTLLDKGPVSSTALTMDQSNPSFLVAADRIRPWAWRSFDGGSTWADFVDFSSQGLFWSTACCFMVEHCISQPLDPACMEENCINPGLSTLH